jgi:ribosomal protein L37AE/L43A
MSEEDFIVGYTLFKPGGFRTRYQHFDKLEVAKMFASNVNLKDNSKIYVPLELYKKQQKEIEELKKENRFLKNHEYTSICKSCKKEFYHKRPNVLWCKECAKTMHNMNYYANLSEEKKKERAEKSKLAMRKIREMRKINND